MTAMGFTGTAVVEVFDANDGLILPIAQPKRRNVSKTSRRTLT